MPTEIVTSSIISGIFKQMYQKLESDLYGYSTKQKVEASFNYWLAKPIQKTKKKKK